MDDSLRAWLRTNVAALPQGRTCPVPVACRSNHCRRSNQPDPLLGDHSQRNSRQFRQVHYRTFPLGTLPDAPLPTLSCRLSAREW